MRHFNNDFIFPNFITSAEIEIDNAGVLNECFELRKADEEGMRRSNRDGWHSKVFDPTNQPAKDSYLEQLQARAFEFGNKVLELHQLNVKIATADWWINISPEYAYNVIHSHPKADLAIVYYAHVNANSGPLVLVRTDGAAHLRLFSQSTKAKNKLEVFPEVGRMYAFPAHLLHCVPTNMSKEERVSIAFNMTI